MQEVAAFQSGLLVGALATTVLFVLAVVAWNWLVDRQDARVRGGMERRS